MSTKPIPISIQNEKPSRPRFNSYGDTLNLKELQKIMEIKRPKK